MKYYNGYVEFSEDEKSVINRAEFNTDPERRCPLCVTELNAFGDRALVECGLKVQECWEWK